MEGKGAGLVVHAMADLRPQWLTAGKPSERRYQMGVRILCCGHPQAAHFLDIFFVNPGDGESPISLRLMHENRVQRLYRRVGHDLGQLTITAPGDYAGQPLELFGQDGAVHWTGWVCDGVFYGAE